VLLRIYTRCIDEQADAANKRITGAIATPDARSGPGDSDPTA